ncbi:MAG: hypothetical protein CVU00_04130 [Bacteroidetes bacterium HGW-Bacteroidetes-17]|nr:MAG: hypothetical protein CVU00_04130 [Bacteroidetes bacterium HGW-Bacteroidetes-17]
MKTCWLILGFTIFFINTVQPQDEKVRQIIEKKLESMLENAEESIETSELIEQLLDLSNNPININSSDIQRLVQLNLLNDQQYYSILNYQKRVGKIQSVQEVQFLDGFNKEILNSIEPFIYAGEETSAKLNIGKILRNTHHQMFIRYDQIVQPKMGYKTVDEIDFLHHPNNSYLGTPSKIYTKYKLHSGDAFSAGFVIEKDPGEVLFKNNYPISRNLLLKKIPLIDFCSFHVSASNIGIIKKIVVGDYHLQLGQGLTLWSNFAFNKSSEVGSVKRNASGIIPSTSTIENNFFRGIALALAKGKTNFYLFYSNKNRDANAYESDEKGQISSFTALQNTGLHRTVDELNDRNILNEQILGTRLSYNFSTLQLSSTAYFSKWDATFLASDQLYKKYDFSGNNNNCIGLDYKWFFKNTSFYGEFSMSKNKGFAYLTGMDFHPDSYSNISLLYRNYEANYQNLYANAFAEGTLSKNEKGLYLGFDNWFLPKWQIRFYADVFRFPWLKSGVNAPSKGLDYFIQINHTFSETMQLYLRYKHKNKQVNSSNEYWFNELVDETKESLRLDLTYKLNDEFGLKSRLEWANYRNTSKKNENGLLIFQQVEYSSTRCPVGLVFRYTNFNTEGFESRIYTYENDVLYAFSIPSFYDIGNHFYLLLNYKVSRHLSCWLKFAHTYYNKKECIGTGNEEIDGSAKSEIRIQLRIQL